MAEESIDITRNLQVSLVQMRTASRNSRRKFLLMHLQSIPHQGVTTTLSEKPTLLWVDMKVSRQESDIAALLEDFFKVRQYLGLDSLDAEVQKSSPAVLCFDFDFPTKLGLQTLQRTKQSHPRIPILMLTVQHSEALAVWAFRSKVWDYLVKPIAVRELERCLAGLREMLAMQELQPQGRTPAIVRSLIPEENRLTGQRGPAPLVLSPAVEYVERCYREKISSGQAAQHCGLTTFQLSRLFKETYGHTFQDYVLRFRVREACRLLKNPEAEIAEVGFLVGFNDPSYFAKVFRRYMDCSPSQFHLASQNSPDTDLIADLELEASRSE
jgi:YesN/AraC family two-component response regulator